MPQELTADELEILRDFRALKAHGKGRLFAEVYEGNLVKCEPTFERRFKTDLGKFSEVSCKK